MIRIAYQFAMEYDQPLDECIQNASIGLIEAVNRYDSEKYATISGYCSMYIYRNLQRSIINKRPLVYYPVNMKSEIVSYYSKVKHFLETDSVLNDNDTENVRLIKKNTDITDDNDAYNLLIQLTPLASFEQMSDEILDASDDPRWWYDFSESEGIRVVNDKLFIEKYKAIMENFGSRERQVFDMYYGIINDNPQTLQAIGDRFGITRERSRQIILKVKRKLIRIMHLSAQVDEKTIKRLKPKNRDCQG